MADEIDLNEQEEKALDRAWDKLRRDEPKPAQARGPESPKLVNSRPQPQRPRDRE